MHGNNSSCGVVDRCGLKTSIEALVDGRIHCCKMVVNAAVVGAEVSHILRP